jgi:ABC-type spermidine/putrescine transport system permease subunit I
VFITAIGYYITPALLGGAGDQMVSYYVAYFTNVPSTGAWPARWAPAAGGHAGAVRGVPAHRADVTEPTSADRSLCDETCQAFVPPYTPLAERGWYYALRACASLVLLYLVLPILAIVPLSFSDSSFLAYPITGWSLRWYQNLFEAEEWRVRAAKNSFIVAPAATVIATVLGTLAATGLAQGELPRQGLLMAC